MNFVAKPGESSVSLESRDIFRKRSPQPGPPCGFFYLLCVCRGGGSPDQSLSQVYVRIPFFPSPLIQQQAMATPSNKYSPNGVFSTSFHHREQKEGALSCTAPHSSPFPKACLRPMYENKLTVHLQACPKPSF